MSTKHTPGPWQVTDGKNYLTEIEAKSQRGKSWVIARTTASKTGQDVARANARLIAAAPDMLALLIELTDIEGPQPGTSTWGGKVAECIAKATGRKDA